jgi:uncharacterized protein (DUF58 family)
MGGAAERALAETDGAILSAAVVAGIDDLSLAARVVVEGMKIGGYRSPFRGFSAEFREHRPYRAGDDLRHVDWKLLARTDRLYTRQFRETTNYGIMLVFDTSASMGVPAGGLAPGARDDGAPSPFRTAQIMAAALAYLAIGAGDAAGLIHGDDNGFGYLPARSGRMHLAALLAHLERLEPRGRWQGAEAIRRGTELLKRRGLLLVISDLQDDEEALQQALRLAIRRGHDVRVLHVASDPTRGFPTRGTITFEDAETGAHQRVNAAAVVAGYQAALEAFDTRWRERSRGDGVGYTRVPVETPPSLALRSFLLGGEVP